MSSSLQLPLTQATVKYSLLDSIQTRISKSKLRVAQKLGTHIPPLGRWADRQQAIYRAQVKSLCIEQHFGKEVYDRVTEEFANSIGKPLTQRKLQKIANRAEFFAIEESLNNSLQANEDITMASQMAYAKANSIVSAQAPALSLEIIQASEHLRSQPELITKAKQKDDDAQLLLNALSESVIREQLQKTSQGFTPQELKIEARLILDRLNDPADWAINRFRNFNQLMIQKDSNATEVLTALRELSGAFELNHFVKGKRFEAPQDRLTSLTNQLRNFLSTDKLKSEIDPNKWLSAFMKHPVIIQCWQISSSSEFLNEVQEHIEEKLGQDASEAAIVSASRDRVLIESLLTFIDEHAQNNLTEHRMEVTSIPVNMAHVDGQSAADFVRADFWDAINKQVAKETSFNFEALRSATEEAKRIFKT